MHAGTEPIQDDVFDADYVNVSSAGQVHFDDFFVKPSWAKISELVRYPSLCYT
ncbi:MAG: hypothetical protein K6U04_08095 [Armatimonadetes bacterium]|nr:hypothetical protein [Armatimonadota bacterium]